MVSVTDSTFKQEVLDFQGKVFVDFWAEWCGPCKVMLPRFSKLSEELSSSSVKFVKYEAGSEDCNQVLTDYNIVGIPTFLMFDFGKNIDRFVGTGNLEDFVSRLL